MISDRAILTSIVAGQLAGGMYADSDVHSVHAGNVVDLADKIIEHAIDLHPYEAPQETPEPA